MTKQERAMNIWLRLYNVCQNHEAIEVIEEELNAFENDLEESKRGSTEQDVQVQEGVEEGRVSREALKQLDQKLLEENPRLKVALTDIEGEVT